MELSEADTALLVVSGGSTPVECFKALSVKPLAWNQIKVTLTDERCVPLDHSDSNQRLIQRTLLVDHAASAEFLPLSSIPSIKSAGTLVGMGA